MHISLRIVLSEIQVASATLLKPKLVESKWLLLIHSEGKIWDIGHEKSGATDRPLVRKIWITPPTTITGPKEVTGWSEMCIRHFANFIWYDIIYLLTSGSQISTRLKFGGHQGKIRIFNIAQDLGSQLWENPVSILLHILAFFLQNIYQLCILPNLHNHVWGIFQ